MLKKYLETLIVIMLIKTTDFGWQYNLIWDNRWIGELPLINYANNCRRNKTYMVITALWFC